MRRAFILIVPLFVVLAAALAASAATQSSPQISYTGQITENGTPMNGRHLFEFTVSSGTGASSAIQAESLDVRNGVFRTSFSGAIAGLLAGHSSPGGETPTLAVSVDGGPQLPAIPVSVIPQAMEAAHAETASALLNAAPPPGVAYVDHDSPAFVGVTTGWSEVDNVTLLAPADGWVFVSANGQLILGSFSQQGCVRLRLAESTPGSAESGAQGCGGNGLNQPFSIEQMLPVTAGSHTLRLFAKGTGPSNAGTYHLQAIWMPLRYQP